ncbi:MAG: hypothetical protein ABSB49_19725 [Polyangia bacterium]
MKFSKIDELTRPEHIYLAQDDVCYYLREYTPRVGFCHSDTNSIVQNFKKPVDRRNRPEWAYKEQSVLQIALELRQSFSPKWLRAATLVPMPPSASKDDPRYDDRLVRVLRAIRVEANCDVRELLVQTGSTEPDHNAGEARHRLTPDEREEIFAVDPALVSPAPAQIGVVDDVLTNGSHFVAAKRVLRRQFPHAPIIGIFFARRQIAA